MSGSAEQPLVSVLMVARNTGPFIGAAIASARAQTYRRIEIVVVDDASTDETRAIADRHAAADPRVRVLDGPRAGLAAVRNASLAAASGRYAAILDSDDLLHPDHIGRLVAAARETGAEITVANMIEFGDAGLGDGTRRVRRFAKGKAWETARPVRIDEYVLGNAIGAEVVLGYLKPLFDLDFLRAHALEYDRRLRIGEDFDLVFRAMLAGARLHYLPEPGYFYRRHPASTSARSPVADLEAQLVSDREYRLPDNYALWEAAARRRRALAAALRATHAIEALKARRPGHMLRLLGGDGQAWLSLGRSVSEAVAKRWRRLGRGSRPNASPDGSGCALVLGEGGMAPQLAELIAAWQAQGVTIAHALRGEEGAHEIADGLCEPSYVVLAEPGQRDNLPFAIAPEARVFLPCGTELRAGPAA